MQLSPHFTLQVLIASDTAARLSIDNTPAPAILANLRLLAAGLEQVVAALGGRVPQVNSAYRCEALNAAVGGAATSMHKDGLAADIVCPGFGAPLAVCRAIVEAGVAADQVIHEYGKWCHVAFAPAGRAPRGQWLTIASATRGYEEGLHPVA